MLWCESTKKNESIPKRACTCVLFPGAKQSGWSTSFRPQGVLGEAVQVCKCHSKDQRSGGKPGLISRERISPQGIVKGQVAP